MWKQKVILLLHFGIFFQNPALITLPCIPILAAEPILLLSRNRERYRTALESLAFGSLGPGRSRLCICLDALLQAFEAWEIYQGLPARNAEDEKSTIQMGMGVILELSFPGMHIKI
ncbi:hypothetical protein AVEN_106529-1 [Araneus ventricosus]|uniref:Uncharacterized protein n=1 Tax=Araneus ventricosus TaxID=182803 RepID=A0A4Y2G3N6_ARAVE|nr:hypothetical protein AVEN_106529-1 [Araneus ventricosus]